MRWTHRDARRSCWLRHGPLPAAGLSGRVHGFANSVWSARPEGTPDDRRLGPSPEARLRSRQRVRHLPELNDWARNGSCAAYWAGRVGPFPCPSGFARSTRVRNLWQDRRRSGEREPLPRRIPPESGSHDRVRVLRAGSPCSRGALAGTCVGGRNRLPRCARPGAGPRRYRLDGRSRRVRLPGRATVDDLARARPHPGRLRPGDPLPAPEGARRSLVPRRRGDAGGSHRVRPRSELVRLGPPAREKELLPCRFIDA